MRILLQANTWTYGLFSGLWRALRDRGHEVFCDFMLPDHEAHFRRENGVKGEGSIVGTCRSWVAQNMRAPSLGEVAQLEQRLALRLPETWAADIFHVKFGVLPRRSAALQRDFFERCFVASAEYYKRVLDVTKPEVILFEGPNTFMDKVLFATATARGIPALNLQGGLTERKVGLSHGPHYRNLLFEKLFSDKGTLPSNAVSMAREYINSLRSLAVKEAYYNANVGKRASWNFDSGVNFIAKLTHGAVQTVRPLSSEERRWRHLMWMTDNTRRPLYSIERRLNEHYVLRQACEPASHEDFAAFYLHFQPEATTSAQAPYFINQNSLCEAIAISMPSDVCFT